MADKKSVKEQRDLFLAFAFASADLFLEVGKDGTIEYAMGAAVSLTGIDHTQLKNRDWLSLFAKQDHAALNRLRKRAQDAQRLGPLKVKISEDFAQDKEAILTAIKMPENDSFHIAVGFPSAIMLKMADTALKENSDALLDKTSFLYAATEAFDYARSIGEDLDMTLLEIPRTQELKEEFGEEMWGGFTQTIQEVLAEYSIDGSSAALIEEGRYSIIHEKELDSETIRSRIEEAGKQALPEAESLEIQSKTVSSDLKSLSERETTKALIYTINEFERKGTNLSIETLNSGFKAYVSANAQKIHQFKSIIEQLNFNLEFQPIVSVFDLGLSHFEIVSRFKGEGSTQEWIVFGEDIGMAADFDMAVTERVLNYLLYKASTNRYRFAMNLSGQSIQNEQFFKTLLAKLDMRKELASRLIFEITESTTITEFEMVNHFIQTLQERGYQICLDDFGAGAASFKNLQQLHVDFIKIDGQYTRRIMSSQRDQILVKNLCQLCKDLEIKVIAEMLETDEQVGMMAHLGIQLGQGYYFGYPYKNPKYAPEDVPANAKENKE